MQDIVQPKRNEINHEPEERVIHPTPRPPRHVEREPRITGTDHSSHSKRGIWIIAIVAVLALFFALSFFFSGATIRATPHTYQADLDNDLVAKKEAGEGELPFEVMSLKGEESQIVTGGDPQTVSKKAVGRVIIYNKWSDKPQHLLINTRLESSAGQIYKTDVAITVPGYTQKGADVVPGSYEVAVTADTAGPTGNTDMTDFTIPGFKGGPKYDKFFARSKTAISGGIEGLVYSAPTDQAAKTKDDVLATLHAKLLKQASAQIPKGYILYPNASYFITDDEPLVGDSATKDVVISQKGTLYAFIFDRTKLSTAIAKVMVSQYDGADISIPDLSSLEFTLKNSDQNDQQNSAQITLHLKGSVKIVWAMDTTGLAKELTGKKKADIESVLGEHKNIDTAEVVIRPFWKMTFPEDPAKIRVINTAESN